MTLVELLRKNDVVLNLIALSESLSGALQKVLETDNVRAILDPTILDRPATE